MTTTKQTEQPVLTDEQIDALDTFVLNWHAPRGKESVREFARAIEAAILSAQQAAQVDAKDTERLDWLLNHGTYLISNREGKFRTFGDSEYFDGEREAIDAAMSMQKKEQI